MNRRTRHKGLGGLLILLSTSPLMAAQLTDLRCAIQPDGGYRIVLDLDEAIPQDQVELPAAVTHRLSLSGLSLGEDMAPANCGQRLVAQVQADGARGVMLMLDGRTATTGQLFTLRPYAGRGNRLVVDLRAADGGVAPGQASVAAASPRTAAPTSVAPAPDQLPASVAGAEPASPWQVRGYVAAETRLFAQSAQYAGQQGSGLSLVAEPEFFRTWHDDSFSFRPYLRWDQHDSRRTDADIRELLWLRAGDGWELAAGIGKVFWGVTEAYHLVDVINQTDQVVNPDGEQKLGQPMVRAALERDWGTLTLFAMPYFRERTYPGRAGRFRTPLVVDTDQASYRDGRSQWDWDWALRWSQYFGDIDIGLAHFHGTGREPTLVSGTSGGQPVLVPVYELIDQTSLDAQLTRGDWLWKLELMRRSGQGEAFWATTGGFEYTLVGIADSAADLGLLGELMYDSRGDDATTPFNHDVFVGLRWTANDVAGSSVLAGVIRDWDNGATAFSLEASRRFGQRWTLQLQARGWYDVPASDPLAPFSRDDYVEIGLRRYF